MTSNIPKWIPMCDVTQSARIRCAVRFRNTEEIHDLNAYCDLDQKWCWGYTNEFVTNPGEYDVLIERPDDLDPIEQKTSDREKNKTKPIKPEDAKKIVPEVVIECFNEIIQMNLNNGESTFKQKDVVEMISKRGIRKKDIYGNGYLDIEDIYKALGWNVEYDGPAYNETYDATFTFKRKKR